MLRFIAGIIAGALIAAPLTAVAVDPVPTVELEPGQEVVVRAKPHATPTLAPTASPTVQPTPVPTPAPTLVWLVDPSADQRVRQLSDSDQAANPFALEVVTSSTGSVRTTLDGGAVRNENAPPFAPCGDQSGDFAACDWAAGQHVLTVEVYSLDNGGGTLVASASLTLEVLGASATNVSGIPVRSPPAGFVREGMLEFTATQALGSGPSASTAVLLKPRPNLAGDCTFNDSSGRGRYCWKATTSEHDGMLDIWHHTEAGSCKTSGFTLVHNGSASDPACNYVAAPIWNIPDQSKFAVTYVARFDDIPGRKVAVLRWCGPKINTAGYCEDNFVEAKLDGGDCKGNAFHHLESSNQQQSQQLCIDLNDWHEYRMVVTPGVAVDFILDGVNVLHATQGVTTASSYWVFQTETYLAGQTIPQPDNQGHIQIDWLTIDLPS